MKRWARRTLKGVGIAVGVLVVADVVAAFVTSAMLRAEVARVRAVLGEISEEELKPRPLPDEENAAVPLLQVSEMMDELAGRDDGTFEAILNVCVPLDDETWAGSVRTAKNYFDQHPEVLALLRDGVSRPGLSLPWEERSGTVFASGNIRSLIHLPTAMARIALEEGDYRRAYDACALALRLGGVLEDSTDLIDALNRSSMLGVSIELLEQVMNATTPTESQAAAIVAELDADTLEPASVEAVRRQVRAGVASWEDRVAGSGANELYVQWFIKGNRLRMALGRLYLSPVCQPTRNLDVLSEMRMAPELFEMADKRWVDVGQRLKEMEAALPPWAFQARTALTCTRYPLQSRARAIAGMRCARAAVLLKRYKAEHGAYPDELPAEMQLADPFSDGVLLYAREGEGFVVYSVSANQVDDGGSDVHHTGTIFPEDLTFRCAN